MTAPAATVLFVHGNHATVACPYCGGRHVHEVHHRGHGERHAPGCGLVRTPDQRATGYRFTTTSTTTPKEK